MMSGEEILAGTQACLMANYGRLPIAVARAAGSRVWDASGAEYIDMFAGFGAAAIGHCHKAVVSAIKEQAAELMCVGNLFTWQSQVELAQAITQRGFGGKVFFCHSGAEANEAAMKLARRAAGPGRYKMISFTGCFHGRTMGSLSMTAKPQFHEGFEPMLPGCSWVEFGDLQAVEDAIDAETAGIIIEPIQGEGGIHEPMNEFMKALRRLCDQHNLALICDEVWTAPARTGQWYGYQHYDVVPDIMTLGKAVGGGVPVAACVAGKGFDDVLTPGTHGCTLGGNPVCAAAGAAVYKVIEEEGLVEAAARKGRWIVETLADAKIDRIRQVRGKGLMLGLELTDGARDVFNACLTRGVMLNVTAGSVVRIAPPMTIEDSLLEKGLTILIEELKR